MKNFIFILLSLLLLKNGLCYSQSKSVETIEKEADLLESNKNFDKSVILWKSLIKLSNDKKNKFYSGRYFFAKGNIEANNGNYEVASQEFKQALSFFSESEPTKTIKKWISTTYLELSYCYYDWDEALKINKKGLEYTAKNLPKDTNIISFLVDQGDIYRRIRNYEQSIISLEKALKKINSLTPDDYENLGYTHNLLGISYSDLHIHNQSLYHYSKGLENHIKSNTADKAYVVNSMNNVIWENLDYGDEKKAREVLNELNINFYKWYHHKTFATTDAGGFKNYNLHFKALLYLSNLRLKSLEKNETVAKQYLDSISIVFKSYPDERKKIDNTLLLARYEFDNLYSFLTRNDKTKINEHINFAKKTLEIAKFSESKHDELVAYLKLAIVYNRHKKYNEALAVINDSKKINESFFNASRFSIQVLEATILNSINQPQKAKQVLVGSFENLLKEKIKAKSLKNIKYKNFNNFNSSTFLRNILNSATIYLLIYEKSKNKEDILVSNNLFFIASEMFAEFYQKGKYNESLKTFNQEIASGLLETQLLINPNDKLKIKTILNRIENNSSQHLWNIFEAKNSQNLKIPATLIKNLNELVFEKNAIETQMESSKEVNDLNLKLAELNKKINEIKSQINQKDKSYETFKSGNFLIEDIQKKINNNQIMIKYVITGKTIYAYAIKNSSVELIEIGKTEPIKKLVNQHLKHINSINQNYTKTSKLLYEKIVYPIVKNQSINDIIFIPDDFLIAVSFESLIDKNGKMLVQNHHTSYAYSIKLWNILQKNDNSDNNVNRFVSFAPNYSKIPTENQNRGLRRADLYDLKEAKIEAQKISELFSGKLYMNENANRKNFIDATTSFSLHHLAMHSLLENDYSKSSLVFSGGQKVYFDELYQLNFPSDLVVLSACNTGIGTMESGEGMMSLSRALTYSGVKSSVYSLWQVPDKETSEIMISFYENLKNGQPKDEALANAKKEFLANNPMKQHPFYWAGFVVNGDISPIANPTNNWIWFALAGGILILILGFVFRKKLF